MSAYREARSRYFAERRANQPSVASVESVLEKQVDIALKGASSSSTESYEQFVKKFHHFKPVAASASVLPLISSAGLLKPWLINSSSTTSTLLSSSSSDEVKQFDDGFDASISTPSAPSASSAPAFKPWSEAAEVTADSRVLAGLLPDVNRRDEDQVVTVIEPGSLEFVGDHHQSGAIRAVVSTKHAPDELSLILEADDVDFDDHPSDRDENEDDDADCDVVIVSDLNLKLSQDVDAESSSSAFASSSSTAGSKHHASGRSSNQTTNRLLSVLESVASVHSLPDCDPPAFNQQSSSLLDQPALPLLPSFDHALSGVVKAGVQPRLSSSEAVSSIPIDSQPAERLTFSQTSLCLDDDEDDEKAGGFHIDEKSGRKPTVLSPVSPLVSWLSSKSSSGHTRITLRSPISPNSSISFSSLLPSSSASPSPSPIAKTIENDPSSARSISGVSDSAEAVQNSSHEPKSAPITVSKSNIPMFDETLLLESGLDDDLDEMFSSLLTSEDQAFLKSASKRSSKSRGSSSTVLPSKSSLASLRPSSNTASLISDFDDLTALVQRKFPRVLSPSSLSSVASSLALSESASSLSSATPTVAAPSSRPSVAALPVFGPTEDAISLDGDDPSALSDMDVEELDARALGLLPQPRYSPSSPSSSSSSSFSASSPSPSPSSAASAASVTSSSSSSSSVAGLGFLSADRPAQLQLDNFIPSEADVDASECYIPDFLNRSSDQPRSNKHDDLL